jgi:hypothetical protein
MATARCHVRAAAPVPVVRSPRPAGTRRRDDRLVIGIWVRPLAILTAAALVRYFVIAMASHVRAADFGRNLFLNCAGMLLASATVLAFTIAA